MLASGTVIIRLLATGLLTDRDTVNIRNSIFKQSTLRLYVCSFALLLRSAILELENREMDTHNQGQFYENRKLVHQNSAQSNAKRLANADWLNQHQSAEKEYDYVKSQCFNESQDAELLWRFGRACYRIYHHSNASNEVKANAVRDGLKACEKAVELEPRNSFAFTVSMHA